MNRRLVVAGVAGAAVLDTVVPCLAATAVSSPVGVSVSTSNGVAVGVDVEGRPGVAVSSNANGVCVGISLQVPQCVPVTIQGPSKPATREALPVVVYHDSNETAVGVNNVGVIVYSSGRVCPVVSTQDWQCF